MDLEFKKNIIFSLLTGENYREHVLAIINKRFISKVLQLAQKTVDCYEKNKASTDIWLDQLINNNDNKTELMTFGGVNSKTIKNLTGTTKKSVCKKVAVTNCCHLDKFAKRAFFEFDIDLKIILQHEDRKLTLSSKESMRFLNAAGAARMALQGGAWSSIGTLMEKPILKAIFLLLELKENYDFEINPPSNTRQIDAIVFHKYNPIKIELKLLGSGNPEMGDEAIARNIDLFLVDQLSSMMIEQAANKQIKVIQFYNNYALKDIHTFFQAREIRTGKCPTKSELKTKLDEIMDLIFD